MEVNTSSPELKRISILNHNNNNNQFLYRNNNQNNIDNNDTNHNMIESLGSRMMTTEYHDIFSPPPDHQKPQQQQQLIRVVDPLSYQSYNDSNKKKNRLLYIAQYEKNYPQNLACSQPLIEASQYSYNSKIQMKDNQHPFFR